MYRHIVAATDLSSTAKVASDRAAGLALRLGAKLTLVHAGSDPGAPLKELADGYAADVVYESGPPAEIIVNVVKELGGDLLVVGSVGMSGAKRWLLGSVPNKVSHHAPTDLLIVKTDPIPNEVQDYKRILVGTDGSDTATRAVATAARLANELDADAVAICVYQVPAELDAMRADPNDPIAQWNAPDSVRSTPEEFRWRVAGSAQAEDILERAAEHADGLGVEIETRAVEGNAADVLVDTSREDFDVIVVGSVGMTGAKRFALGNVPHRVSHHAPIDVLILKTA
jgi:nucleotide-binding universal stress UspA family protein